MANSNPAFSSPAFSTRGTVPPVPTPGQLQSQFDLPTATPADTGRMSYEDTIVKTAVSFAVLLVGAAVGWFFNFLMLPAAIVGLVLALVNIFKKTPSPALVLSYSGVQGVLVGAVSSYYASIWNGIVPMALLGTLAVVGVTLALFANGKVRASKRATKIFLVAMVGYLAFSLVNFGLTAFGVTNTPGGLRDADPLGIGIPLGIPLGILVVLMAAYSLVLDFDSIQQGVRNGAPRIYGWAGAFGIVMTVVWLYLEVLRLLSYFMPRN